MYKIEQVVLAGDLKLLGRQFRAFRIADATVTTILEMMLQQFIVTNTQHCRNIE